MTGETVNVTVPGPVRLPDPTVCPPEMVKPLIAVAGRTGRLLGALKLSRSESPPTVTLPDTSVGCRVVAVRYPDDQRLAKSSTPWELG